MTSIHTMPTVLIHGCQVWDKEAFPEEEFIERLSRIRTQMKQRETDALLVYGSQSIHGDLCYITNYMPFTRSAVLILPRRMPPTLLIALGSRYVPFVKKQTWVEEVRSTTDYAKESKSVLEEARIEAGKIGLVNIEECMNIQNASRLYNELKDYSLEVSTQTLHEERMVKSQREIKVLRQACRMADKAYQVYLENLKPGRKEYEVVANVEKAVRRQEAEDFRELTAESGISSTWLRPSGNRVIGKKDILMIYLAVRNRRYWGSIGRTLKVTNNSPHNDCLNIATEAQHKLIKNIKPGARVSEVVLMASSIIKSHIPSKQVYGFGGGIGIDLSEEPHIALQSNTVLENDMVLSLQVGIHLKGKGGAFLSDMVLVHEGGARSMHQ